jgi:citrate lyase beta subunit
MGARRSLLFVPGARPDRFDKAVAAGADMVCVDLEDAVPPHLKDEAREVALKWLCEKHSEPERVIRINSLKSISGLRDLVRAAELAPELGFIFLPKVDSPEELRIADKILTEAGSQARLMALIESVDGLEHVQEIATATPRLELLLFGAVDLSAELGCSLDHEVLLYARSRTVHAARRAGIGALDVPSLAVKDNEVVSAEARAARALGFSGKAALHPINIEAIHSAFSPTAREIEQAEKVLSAYEASSTGLTVIDGKLVDKPVVLKMQQIIAAANALCSS